MTGELNVLDSTGDTKLIWDSEKEAEVAAAERTFNDLTKKGYLGYAVNRLGTKGTQLTEFDPEAEKIILAPMMKGG